MRRSSITLVFAALLSQSASAAPPVPATDMVFEPPSIEVRGYSRVDYKEQSINLAKLNGAPVFSSKTERRIGHVDDIFIDSSTGVTYLGLEIGGMFEIGDHEAVLPLDQVSVYRSVLYPPHLYSISSDSTYPSVHDTWPTAGDPLILEMKDLDADTKDLLKKFGYRFERYRIYIAATEEELEKLPEFDIYEGPSD